MHHLNEIGSEFWDVPTTGQQNNIFPEETQWFLAGRSALQAIIKELNDCRTVAMPSWCCDSMVKPFVDAGFDVFFYPVYWNNGICQEILYDCDVLFLMDYFGYTSQIPDTSNYKGIRIRDITHSIFTYSYSDANYYFGSLRKWCGVWTGGYAWTNDDHKIGVSYSDDNGYVSLRKRAMKLKNSYINGYGLEDKEYLGMFNAAEKILDGIGIAPANEQDVWLAHRLEISGIRSQRRANAEILRSAFRDWLIFPKMDYSDCPLFVPILVPNGKRDKLRQYLIDKDIYCPVHWPVSKYHRLNEREQYLYKNELSLVCDQRYKNEDMQRIVDTIYLFVEEN